MATDLNELLPDDGPLPEVESGLPELETGRDPRPSRGFQWGDLSAADAVGLIAVACTLGWAYEPDFLWLYRTWVREPDYTHGFLVLPISAVILWMRWPSPEEARPAPWWPGWLLVVPSLAARAYFDERGNSWPQAATLLPLSVGLALARLGPRVMYRIWPAFAFLIFLLPLPQRLNGMLSQPLQTLATTFSYQLLRLSGLWVIRDGNVILVGTEKLEVAAACNGLSMLMSLSATIAATASLVPMTTVKRCVLLASIVPIALGCNVLRIAATAWCYHSFGAEVGTKYAHDLAGWLMMPLAMVLVGLELALMSWLVIEEEVEERTTDRLGLNLTTGGYAPVAPPTSTAPPPTPPPAAEDRS